MTYDLGFKTSAKKEWDKLDNSVKIQFKNKLQKILQNPHILANKLSGFENMPVYKIKIMKPAYRLVYKVCDNKITVVVVAIGKRDKSIVYKNAIKRM